MTHNLGVISLINSIYDVIEEHGHAFPLSPGLIPIVYFQNVEKFYLGRPFTTCVQAEAINNYTEWASLDYSL